MRFLQVFNRIEKGDYALTDEAVYASLAHGDAFIPLYGGNQEHDTVSRLVSVTAKTRNNKPIHVFSGEGIIISLDGSAGRMTYKAGERFALNHHAGFITAKEKTPRCVNLRYFSLFFQNHYASMAVSDGSKTLSLDKIYSDEFDLPPVEYQDRVISMLEERLDLLQRIHDLKHRIQRMLSCDIVYSDHDYLEEGTRLSSAANIIQGHQITDEEIYRSEGGIPVYTGRNELKGYWNKSIVEREHLPCITYATKAFDGTVSIQHDLFDANNTAVLYLKEAYKDKIQLEWLQSVLPALLLKNATSKEGVSYLNKEIVQGLTLSIPRPDIQRKTAQYYSRLRKALDGIEAVELQFRNLFSQEIAGE